MAYQRDYLGQDESFTWSAIWEPVKDVFRTSAEVFSKVYPAVKGTPNVYATGYPSPYPQYPQVPARGGYAVSANAFPLPQQQPITASPWFWPVVLGAGGFFLVTQMNKKRS